MKKNQPTAPVSGRPFGTKTFDLNTARIFGEILREYRRAKGLSQEALAEITNLDRNHIGKIERGENLPTLGVLLRLARGIGVRPGILIDETEKLLSQHNS